MLFLKVFLKVRIIIYSPSPLSYPVCFQLPSRLTRISECEINEVDINNSKSREASQSGVSSISNSTQTQTDGEDDEDEDLVEYESQETDAKRRKVVESGSKSKIPMKRYRYKLGLEMIDAQLRETTPIIEVCQRAFLIVYQTTNYRLKQVQEAVKKVNLCTLFFSFSFLSRLPSTDSPSPPSLPLFSTPIPFLDDLCRSGFNLFGQNNAQ